MTGRDRDSLEQATPISDASPNTVRSPRKRQTEDEASEQAPRSLPPFQAKARIASFTVTPPPPSNQEFSSPLLKVRLHVTARARRQTVALRRRRSGNVLVVVASTPARALRPGCFPVQHDLRAEVRQGVILLGRRVRADGNATTAARRALCLYGAVVGDSGLFPAAGWVAREDGGGGGLRAEGCGPGSSAWWLGGRDVGPDEPG